MSTNSTSPSDIVVAWATPVSLAQLGARLFAYVETKAAITTFRLVTSYPTVTACQNLPEEIKSLIASKLRDIIFKRKMKEWVKISKCLANSCTTMSHVPKAEVDSFALMVSSNYAEDEEWLAEQFADSAAEAHQKDVRRYCKVLTNLKDTSRLAKCVDIFTQDFGIRPYFMIHKSYDRYYYDIEEVQAKAYLTLPLLNAPISTDPVPRTSSFSVASILNAAALMGSTEDQLLQFKIATNILNLRVYDPDEDEAAPEDKLKIA